MSKRIESETIGNALKLLTENIGTAHAQTERLIIIGVADGGIEVARRLGHQLSELWGRKVTVGFVNALFHRDDITERSIFKAYMRTDIPESVDDATVILVDDVLFSGRTIRAALNELFDNGRPKAVELAVLCDRGHRKLPVAANYTGMTLETRRTEKVRVFLDEEAAQNDYLTVEEQ
ncbi:MAG: bifunctional pyr operon transcriptional regulator/uracil phosphoribosyltransferase PyrR [Opitutales bacterium]|nr:bifunctional pyr operon transcriptional regulator/uracil phosphoribosyltransferase PyrR [Opitutales bacterium]